MSSDQITVLLTSMLVVCLFILFILVIVLTFIYSKKKKQENAQVRETYLNGNMQKDENINRKGTVQAKTYSSQDIKSFLDFEEIKDNMIIQNKGKRFVMVMQCQGINYDLMSSIEKVGVEQGFVKFLNTITKPIQIYIQARKVNLEESLIKYKNKLKEIETTYNKKRIQYDQVSRDKNSDPIKFKKAKMEYVKQKNLYEYAKDIINNTEKMSLNKNILTKNYYIAISHMPEDTENLFDKEELIEMAFSELYTTAQSLLRVLSVCGVTGRVLDSVELGDLLYESYNRDASEVFGIDKALKAGYDSLYISAPDVMEKKIEELDKLIEEKAISLANSSIEQAVINSKKQRELEQKEANLQKLIDEMAESLIDENEDYIGKEIAEQAKSEIKSKKKSKKGA